MRLGMFDLNPSPASTFGFITLAGLLAVSARSAFGLPRTKNKYPPGPKGIPFFGTRLSSTPWKDFEQWGKEYGKYPPIVGLEHIIGG